MVALLHAHFLLQNIPEAFSSQYFPQFLQLYGRKSNGFLPFLYLHLSKCNLYMTSLPPSFPQYGHLTIGCLTPNLGLAFPF